MNSIPSNQELPKQIERLTAQDSLYSEAARLQTLQIVLTVPVVVVFSVVALLIPSSKAYSACWALIVLFLDVFFFEVKQRALKSEAAKIQEQFDCDILELPWRDLLIESRPDVSIISEFAAKYRARNDGNNRLGPWYQPEVGQLPIALARINCQAENCDWDSKLRRKYASWIPLILVLFVLGICVIGLVGGFSLDGFILTVLYPVLPAVKFGVQQYREHNQAADTLDRQKDYCGRLWRLAITGTVTSEQLKAQSRELQDGIYERRRRDPLVPTSIYRRFANKYGNHLRKASLARIDEAIESMNRTA